MITISPTAITYIQERNNIIFLQLPPKIDCCLHLQEAPMISIGLPPKAIPCSTQEIDGITVYLPNDFPEVDFTIDLSSFLGFKKLVIENWHLA